MSEQQNADQQQGQGNDQGTDNGGQNEPQNQPQEGDQGKSQEQMFPESYVKDLRSEAAKYRKQLKEKEDAEKSDQQKLIERAETAEKRIAAFEDREKRAGWAATVSEETGVPASVLRGDSQEEMKKHAEQIKALQSEEEPKDRNVFRSLDKKPSGKNQDKKSFVSDLFSGES